MSRRKLPVLGGAEGATAPTMAALRARLGGRVEGPGTPDAGRPVTVGGELGVLLSRDDGGCDVWLGHNRVRRAAAAAVFALPGPPPAEFAAAAQAARRFADLVEGERVSFVAPGGRLEPALLFEKCRFGALVARDDGTVLGVGFQRLWPPPAAELNLAAARRCARAGAPFMRISEAANAGRGGPRARARPPRRIERRRERRANRKAAPARRGGAHCS